MNVSETAALLAAQDDILILTHKRPDGDTIGCAAGLCAALRALGKTAWALPNSDVSSLFAPYLEPYLAPAEVQPAFVVTVDLAARSLFTQEGEAWLKRGIDLAIDHHPSYEGFGKESCVDPGRAGVGPRYGRNRPAPLRGRIHRYRVLPVQQHHPRHPPHCRRPDGDGH